MDRNIRVLVTRPCIDKLPGQQGRWWQSKAKAAIATDQQRLYRCVNCFCYMCSGHGCTEQAHSSKAAARMDVAVSAIKDTHSSMDRQQ